MTHNLSLPRGHLSFSQIDLWLKSPETYRRKYYGGVDFATTPAMAFGKLVTEAMERNEEWVAFIPRHPLFEREFIVPIEGIPIRAAIDNMDPTINRFREQKTGKTPWTQNKADKHLQLDIYSLLLETADGFVDDKCDLIWVQTRNVEKKVTMTVGDQVIEMDGVSTDIELTGEYKIFERIIDRAARQACRDLIVRVGRAIEEDFAAYRHLYERQT